MDLEALAPLARRDFVDDAGTLWLVSEWEAADVPGARGERYLVFDSLNVCRRLWSYPADWHELPSDTREDGHQVRFARVRLDR